jgi:hypothetical protein
MSLAGAIQLCILGGYMENIHLQMEDGFVDAHWPRIGAGTIPGQSYSD